jgi:hypothetical protein
MSTTSLSKLQAAIKGLLYPSDTDAPFEILTAASQENLEANVRQLLDVGTKLEYHERLVEEFFQELEPDKGFQKLHGVLKHELTGLKIYCFGEVNVIVAIAGNASDGTLVVLKTTSVET